MTRGDGQIHTDSRAQTEKPPFTVGTLRKAIPAHCFERSIARSFAYLGVDLALVAALYGFSQIIEAKAPLWLALIAWPLYWFFQVITSYGYRFAREGVSKYTIDLQIADGKVASSMSYNH